MPYVAVRRNPVTGHVDVPIVDSWLSPRGEMRGSRIDCATEQDARDVQARLTAAIEAGATSVRAAVVIDRNAVRRAAHFAAARQAGATLRAAQDEADAEYPPKNLTVRVVDADDATITAALAAERSRAPIAGVGGRAVPDA